MTDKEYMREIKEYIKELESKKDRLKEETLNILNNYNGSSTGFFDKLKYQYSKYHCIEAAINTNKSLIKR